MSDTYNAAELLLRLGDHPDAVHQALKDKGYKGLPENCNSCPVANYLKGETGVKWVVGKNRFWNKTEGPLQKYDLPRQVKLFIESFDNYKYLDLISTGAIEP